MSALFQALHLRELTLPNRIMVSPMCQYSAVDGSATDWHIVHLGGLAMSGAGMLCLEATAVEPEGRITPGCLGLWNDANEAALARVLGAIRGSQGVASTMPIAMQLAHAGRKGSSAPPWEGGMLIDAARGGWTPLAPSAIPQHAHEAPPAPLDEAGIRRIRDAFVASARRAARLGIDAIELHAAHGYLLHQFLSPLSNQRQDGYGGSLENRMRLTLEIFTAVREVFPAGRPVGVRVSATDWVEGGWDLEQTLVLCEKLKALGCDWIDVSTGGLSPQQQIPLGPGYQVPFAEKVREATGLPTMAVGLITDAKQAEEIVASGRADMVAIARAFLYNPHWAWEAAATLGASIAAPHQYWRGFPRHAKNLFGDVRFGQR